MQAQSTMNRRNLRMREREVARIPIEAIRPNPYQPRRVFAQEALEELCASIKQYGLLQPISVRKAGNDAYELIAGERRLRACRMAGLTTIDAIVFSAYEQDSAVIAMMENLQRENLHYMEEAEGADRVVILDGGKIAADGTPAALKDRYSSCRLRLYGEEAPLAAALSAAGLSFVREGEALCAQIKDGAAVRAFLAANPGISDFEFLKGSMDDVFLSVTGRSLAGGVQ